MTRMKMMMMMKIPKSVFYDENYCNERRKASVSLQWEESMSRKQNGGENLTIAIRRRKNV
jgi:hypothetical protein